MIMFEIFPITITMLEEEELRPLTENQIQSGKRDDAIMKRALLISTIACAALCLVGILLWLAITRMEKQY
jgi:hypothetical protein